MGRWRYIYFVYSMEMCSVTMRGALSCVWRQWSIYQNRREGYTEKVMTSSYSSNAAALIQEKMSFWESAAQGSVCLPDYTGRSTPCPAPPLEIPWDGSQAEKLLGNRKPRRFSSLASWGLIRNEAGERNRDGLGKDFVGHMCELELNPITRLNSQARIVAPRSRLEKGRAEFANP